MSKLIKEILKAMAITVTLCAISFSLCAFIMTKKDIGGSFVRILFWFVSIVITPVLAVFFQQKENNYILILPYVMLQILPFLMFKQFSFLQLILVVLITILYYLSVKILRIIKNSKKKKMNRRNYEKHLQK